MADPGMPPRGGDTLGDYYRWSQPLYEDKCINIWQRYFMRDYFNEGKEPLPESVRYCPSADALGL